MIFYRRPFGVEELRPVFEARLRVFRLQLPEQSIVHPVLDFGYAGQVARDRNTKTWSCAGYVTWFEVEDDYAPRFEGHTTCPKIGAASSDIFPEIPLTITRR